MSLSMSVANPLITTYAAHLGADPLMVGFLTGMLFGVSTIMRPFSGPAIVKFDKRNLLFFALALGIVVNIMYGLFGSITMFIIARIMQGMQFSVMGSLLMTIAGDSLPKQKIASGVGIFGISAIIATALGPSIGLAVYSFGKANYGEAFGYSAIFYVSAFITCIAAIPAFLVRPHKTTKEQIASVGVWYKNIISPAAIPPSICLMFYFMSYSLYNAYMVPYAAEKGFTGIAVFFTIYAAITLVTRPLSGKIIDKYGFSSIIFPSVVFYIASLVLLWKAQSIGAVYLSAVFSALGFGSSFPGFQAICLQSVPRIKRGVASNTMYFGIDIGQSLGPLMAGLVISAYAGTGHSHSITYLFGVIPVILAVIIYVVFRKYLLRKVREAEEFGE